VLVSAFAAVEIFAVMVAAPSVVPTQVARPLVVPTVLSIWMLVVSEVVQTALSMIGTDGTGQPAG
jgi:hypothetical protein